MQGGLFYKNTYGVLSRGRGLELQSYGILFSLIEISQVFEYIYIYIYTYTHVLNIVFVSCRVVPIVLAFLMHTYIYTHICRAAYVSKVSVVLRVVLLLCHKWYLDRMLSKQYPCSCFV